jgi:hypothetical protein
LEHLVGQIDLLIASNPDATIWSIWKTLVEEHQTTVSYGTVRNYVNRTRAQPADTRSAQFLMSRARLFALIRHTAHDNDLIARLAALFSVDHATVLHALTSKDPLPAKPIPTPNPRDPQRLRILTRLRSHIDEMIFAEPGIAILDIWVRLVDDHHAEVSYGTVREYVTREHRQPRQRTATRIRSNTAAPTALARTPIRSRSNETGGTKRESRADQMRLRAPAPSHSI